MSDLANRLVTAAARAIHPAYGPATRRKARLAVAAALRELAEVLEEERRDYASITRLNRLAEVIEKGEQA